MQENTAKDERIETAAETETAPSGAAKTGTETNPASRGYLLKCVAGLYLLYIAWELVNAYLKKEEGSSLGFCAAGIVFGLIGVFLLYIVIRDYLREDRQKKAEAAMQVKASRAEASGTVTKASGTEAEVSGAEANNTGGDGAER